MRLLHALVLAAVFTGCSDPTVDGSSEEAFRTSVADVNASLPEDERDAFQRALAAFALSTLTPAAMVAGAEGEVTAAVRDSLDGMTAEEVIEAARTAPQPDMGAVLEAARDAARGAANAPGSAVRADEAERRAYQDSVSIGRLEVGPRPGGDRQITAVVTNRSSREFRSVEVVFDLFEADGVRARSTTPSIVMDLAPGQAARLNGGYLAREGIDSVAVGHVEVTPARDAP